MYGFGAGRTNSKRISSARSIFGSHRKSATDAECMSPLLDNLCRESYRYFRTGNLNRLSQRHFTARQRLAQTAHTRRAMLLQMWQVCSSPHCDMLAGSIQISDILGRSKHCFQPLAESTVPPVASVNVMLPPLSAALRGPCTCKPCLPPGVLLRALKAFTSGTRYRLWPAARTVPAQTRDV